MTKHELKMLTLMAFVAVFTLFISILCGPAGLPSLRNDLSAWSALLELRAMRSITGFVVGAALAAAGCVLQTILRNPLAEPYILGISSGASVGTALVMTTGLAMATPLLLPLGSFACSLLTILLIMAVARRAGGIDIPRNLILTGIVTGSVLSSLLMLIITFSRTHTIRSITWWMLGNLQCVSWELLLICALPVILGILLLIAEAKTLNAMLLGTENAHNLGINTHRSILKLTGIATLITACAVALSGIIGFSGLIVPHIMRRRIGANHRYLLPMTALGGGVFLVVCDIIGRIAVPPHEIPVGVITALTGGPFFLYLMIKKNQH
jgi:iron complex transport system permease protein